MVNFINEIYVSLEETLQGRADAPSSHSSINRVLLFQLHKNGSTYLLVDVFDESDDVFVEFW